MWMALASTTFNILNGMGGADANNKMAKANRDNAVLSQSYENRGINERLRQEEEALSQQKREVVEAAMVKKSMMQATENGVGGTARTRSSRNVTNHAGRSIANANANLGSYRAQAESDKRATEAKAQSRINSMPYKKYNPMMDLVSGGLQIAGGKSSFDKQQASIGKPKSTWGEYLSYGW